MKQMCGSVLLLCVFALEVWTGMFHVFQSREPLLPEGKEAIDHIAEFVRSSMPPRDIGSRRELFVDRYLIERLDGARLEKGSPTGVASPVR